MFNVINCSILSNYTTVHELSRTPEKPQGQQNAFQGSKAQPVLIANSRKILGAQGRLATLGQTEVTRLVNGSQQHAPRSAC